MNYSEKLRSNINKNYIFTLLKNFNLTHALWMIYLASKGISLLQLGVLEGVFHISSFLMEVPTGMIADIYGRKASRFLGRCFAVASSVIMLLSDNFYMFAFSFIISALSYNLESGAGDALVYDSLKELREEDRYMKVNGRIEMFMQLGLLLAFPLAGYVADKSFELVFALKILVALITAIYALTFTEPTVGRIKTNKENPFLLLKKQLIESVEVVRSNKRIGFLIIFVELILTLMTTLFYYLQNHWELLGYTRFSMGLIFCAGSALAAMSALIAHKLERCIKEKGLLVGIPVAVMLCIWGIAMTKYSPVFYIAMGAIESILFVVTMDYINKLIPSENRATILSMASMVFSFFMIILFPIVGHIGDTMSLGVAFVVIAALGTVLTAINTVIILLPKKR